MSITPSPCGYIVTTKLNCSLEKGKKKKPICHNGVNESTDHCNVLFWGFFLSDEMSFCHYNIGSTLNMFMH